MNYATFSIGSVCAAVKIHAKKVSVVIIFEMTIESDVNTSYSTWKTLAVNEVSRHGYFQRTYLSYSNSNHTFLTVPANGSNCVVMLVGK